MRCLKIKTQDDNCEQAMKNFSLHHSKPIYFDFNLKRKIDNEKKAISHSPFECTCSGRKFGKELFIIRITFKTSVGN